MVNSFLKKLNFKLLLDAVIILVCEGLNVIAVNGFMVPARMLSGGVFGIAMLLNQIWGIPIGAQTLIYNIPIFYLGYRYLGRRFIFLSLIGLVSLSLMVDNIHIPRATNDMLLAAVFGGILGGTADGIILRRGGSTGGFDILGLLVARRFGLSLGQVFLVANVIVISLGALTNNLELAMYTLIMQYVASRVVNTIQETAPRRVALVISGKHELLAQRIMDDLRRGVTYLHGAGAYTGRDFRVLMCVVTRYELVELRALIREIDQQAFTVVLDATDVMGSFEHHSPLSRLFK